MKKILSIILVVVLILTAAIVPSFAKAIDYFSGKELITVKTSSGKAVLQEPSTSHAEELLYYRNSVENPQYTPSRSVTSENVIKANDKITIKNVSGNNLSITVHTTPYTYTGKYYASGMPDAGDINASYYLLDDGSHGAIYAGYLDGFELKNGQSKSFDFNKFIGTAGAEHKISEGAYFAVRISVVNNDSDFYDYSEFEYMIKRTGDLTPVTPQEPEKPEKSESASDMLTVNPEVQYNSDWGYIYDFSVKNTTDKPMTGYYAVLSYHPEKYLDRRGNEYYNAEIHIFDVNIAPGKTMNYSLTSNYQMSNAENMWISFESKAEMEKFVKQNGVVESYSSYGKKYEFNDSAGESVLQKTFGIEFTPAK